MIRSIELRFPAGANFTGPQGPPGLPFTVDRVGPASGRAATATDTTIRSYLEEDTNLLFVKRVDGTYPATGIPFRGPQGIAGPSGPAGPSGATGPQGLPGSNGAPGLNGAAGATGAIGPAGATGLTGPTGPTGATGLTGPTGASGATGTAGPEGLRGLSFDPNATGPFSARAQYDAQLKGYSFLDVDASLLYFKSSDTLADWSVGVTFGKGDPGVAGAAGPVGPIGPAGTGLPAGGATGQVARKKSAGNYDTEWRTLVAGDVGAVAANDPAYTALRAGERRIGLSLVPFGRLAIGAASSELSVDFPAAKAIDGDSVINGTATGGPAKGWLTASRVVSALTTDWINIIVGPMTLVSIGDSLTLGKPGHIPGDPLDDPFSGWQPHLQEMQGRAIVNKGVGGDTSAQVLARMTADVHFFRPAYCAVLAGTNDVSTGVAAGTTQGNLTSIWGSCTSNGTIPILGTIPPYNAGTAAMKQAILDLNTWIRGQAAANSWPLADYYPVLEDPASPGNMRTSEVAADGLNAHPTSQGYARMATAWEKTLQQMTRAPRLAAIGISGRMGPSRPANYVRPSEYYVRTRSPGPTSGLARGESFPVTVGAVEGVDYVSMPAEAAWRYAWFRVGFGAMSGDTTLTGKHTGIGEITVYTQS